MLLWVEFVGGGREGGMSIMHCMSHDRFHTTLGVNDCMEITLTSKKSLN